MKVSYDLSAFKRAKFVGGGKAMRLEADQDDATAIAALHDACEVVTDEFVEREHIDDYVMVGDPVPTPSGPMAPVQDCEPAKALPLMLERVAAELAARGINGRLVPVKTEPDLPFSMEVFPTLGMLLAPLIDTDAMYAGYGSWLNGTPQFACWVEPARLRRVVSELVEWATQVEGQILVGVVDRIEVSRTGLVDYVCSTLLREFMLTLSVTTSDNRRRRQVRFIDMDVIVYDYDPDRPRREQLTHLSDLATNVAPDLSFALVREMGTNGIAVRQLRSIPPTIELFHILQRTTEIKHFQSQYVFDAGVAQVLTSNQLGRTTLDSQRWKVRDLGSDRYLVTDVDPDAWFYPEPRHRPGRNMPREPWMEPDVLATARADFGPAILTLDTVRENPAPLAAERMRNTPAV